MQDWQISLLDGHLQNAEATGTMNPYPNLQEKASAMYSLFLLVLMTKRIPIHVHNLVKQRTIPSITTLENTPNIATIKLFSFLVNAAITLATILKNNAPSSISVQIPAIAVLPSTTKRHLSVSL